MLCRYTCEFNITQYGEDSMTDLTQYSEKVEGKIMFQTLDTFMFSCSGEARVSEGYPQPWLHRSLREQGPSSFPTSSPPSLSRPTTSTTSCSPWIERCPRSFLWPKKRRWGSRRRTSLLRLESVWTLSCFFCGVNYDDCDHQHGHYFVFDDAKYDDDCDDFDDLGCGGVAVKAELQGSVSGWFPCAKQVINQFNQYVGIGIGIPRW